MFLPNFMHTLLDYPLDSMQSTSFFRTRFPLISLFSRCACPPGFTLDKDGHHCKQNEECGRVRVDVIFVLDSSNSLRREDFSEELGVVKEFIEFCQEVSGPKEIITISLFTLQDIRPPHITLSAAVLRIAK